LPSSAVRLRSLPSPCPRVAETTSPPVNRVASTQMASSFAVTGDDAIVLGAYVEGSIDFGNGPLDAIGAAEAGDVGLAKLTGH